MAKLKQVAQPDDVTGPAAPVAAVEEHPLPPAVDAMSSLGLGDQAYIEARNPTGLVTIQARIVGCTLPTGRCPKCGGKTIRELVLEDTGALTYLERCGVARCKSDGMVRTVTREESAALMRQAGPEILVQVRTLPGGEHNVGTYKLSGLKRLPGYMVAK